MYKIAKNSSQEVYILHEVNLIRDSGNKLIEKHFFSGTYQDIDGALKSINSFLWDEDDDGEFNAEHAWYWTIHKSKLGLHTSGQKIAVYDCFGNFVHKFLTPDYIKEVLINGI